MSCLSVLVLVEGHRVGAVLVVIDAVLSLLANFEELADGALHHHVLAVARADASDVTLCVHDQNLQRWYKTNVRTSVFPTVGNHCAFIEIHCACIFLSMTHLHLSLLTSLPSLKPLLASWIAAATCWFFSWLNLLSGFLSRVTMRVAEDFLMPGVSPLAGSLFSPSQRQRQNKIVHHCQKGCKGIINFVVSVSRHGYTA